MLQISENAGHLISKMTVQNGMPGGGLRIGIKAGGCSGLSYTFAWEAAPRENDQVFDGPDGSKVFVDPRSYEFIKGTTLDYDTSLVSRGFVFHNPNAKSTCGCGSSFSV
ncbi:MAG TPA: iron-sulfur cluster assembly accessory protein [Vicinamibacterales bacterium]|nr:iron-sulfur cluster assembly accessory protein [Vicinamibacterales bacterium]